jgi:hypothetical protein
VTPALTLERRERLTRHLESCPRCTGQRGDQVFDPEMLAAIPPATLPLTLRLRITGPALPLGSYHRGGRGRTSASGGNVRRPRVRRGPPRAMMVSSLGLVILALPGALLYELAFTSAVRRASVRPGSVRRPRAYQPAGVLGRSPPPRP